jgi:hypothetical protein
MMKGSAAEELTRQWGKLTLREDENPGIVIKQQTFSPLVQRGRSCLVGKLLSERTITKEVLKTPMVRAWKLSGSVSFRTLGPNLFIVEFEKWWDKDRTLEGRPWTFDGDLFSLVDYDGLTQMEDLEFEKAAFWVRMYKLPLACMGKEVGLQVGSTVGEVEEIDVLDDGVGWGEYLRVKIRIDLTKPLARGRIIKVQDKEIWVAFQFEKIPRFCFTCGTVVHSSRKCGEYGGKRVQKAEETEEFGPWLRVASPKKRFGQFSGWSTGRHGNHRFSGQTDGEMADNHSWRRTDYDGGDGCSRRGNHTGGGREAGTQGEKGLFASGSKSPSTDTDEYGKGDLMGSGNHAGAFADQCIPDMDGADHAEIQQDMGVTAMGTAVSETGQERMTYLKENEQIMEDNMGPTAPAKGKALKENLARSNYGKLPAKTTVGGKEKRAAGSVYVGQWNQIKEKMEWNLMEGSKESFSPSQAATSPREENKKYTQPKGTFKRTQKKLRDNDSHVSLVGPGSLVGNKRREHANGPVFSNPGSSNLHSKSDVDEHCGWKKARASKEESSDKNKIQAAAAEQPRPSQ